MCACRPDFARSSGRPPPRSTPRALGDPIHEHSQTTIARASRPLRPPPPAHQEQPQHIGKDLRVITGTTAHRGCSGEALTSRFGHCRPRAGRKPSLQGLRKGYVVAARQRDEAERAYQAGSSVRRTPSMNRHGAAIALRAPRARFGDGCPFRRDEPPTNTPRSPGPALRGWPPRAPSPRAFPLRPPTISTRGGASSAGGKSAPGEG